jgi:hypothetical protein
MSIKMKITKTQLRQMIKEELLKEGPDWKANDEAMVPAAAELGKWLVGRPDIAEAIAKLLAEEGYQGPLFPKAAAALMQAFEESQSHLDDMYIGADDD